MDTILDSALSPPPKSQTEGFDDWSPPKKGQSGSSGNNGPKFNIHFSFFQIILICAIIAIAAILVYFLFAPRSASVNLSKYSNAAFSFGYPNGWSALSELDNVSGIYSELLVAPGSTSANVSGSPLFGCPSLSWSGNFSSICVSAVPKINSSYSEIDTALSSELNSSQAVSINGVFGIYGANSFESNSILQIEILDSHNQTYLVEGNALGSNFVSEEKEAFSQIINSIKFFNYSIPPKAIQNHTETNSSILLSTGLNPFNITRHSCSASNGMSFSLLNIANENVTISQVIVTSSIGTNTSTANGSTNQPILVSTNSLQVINESKNYGALELSCLKAGIGYQTNVTITVNYVSEGLDVQRLLFGTLRGVASV